MSQICRCDNNYNSIDDKDNGNDNDNDNDDIMIITKKTSRTCHITPNNDNKRVRYITLPSPLLCDSDDMSHHPSYTYVTSSYTLHYAPLPSLMPPLSLALTLFIILCLMHPIFLALTLSFAPLHTHPSLSRFLAPSQASLSNHFESARVRRRCRTRGHLDPGATHRLTDTDISRLTMKPITNR